jgi:hypothetical protein
LETQYNSQSSVDYISVVGGWRHHLGRLDVSVTTVSDFILQGNTDGYR